jgi:pimeloyl-ACP methyl ester carboxylesterase
MIEFNTKRILLPSSIEIVYTDEGLTSSPTLLFIHGLANYRHVWNWNIIHLKTKFRCIALDLPGNGESTRGNYAFDLNFYMNTIIEFLKALKLKQVSFVGHSMGGQIACKMAIENLFPIEYLILCAPSGFEFYASHEVVLMKSALQMGQWFQVDEDHISQSIRSSFYKSSSISKQIIDELTTLIKQNNRPSYRKMMDRSMNAMMDESIFYQLKLIEIETLVFFGERDEFIPNRFLHPSKNARDIAIEACNQLPKARLITYPETGHFVQIEQAQKVNVEIESFMLR